MKPQKPDSAAALFRAQLSQMRNMSHPLVRLSEKMDWQKLETDIDVIYTASSGQPPLPTRLLAGLHYLKYTFNESDERVVARWLENPYWQYFCGYEYLQHKLPLHPTSLVRWRQRVGDRLDALLSHTINVALQTKAMSVRELDHVNADTTVQEKAITFPTDAKLYNKMREALVVAAERKLQLLDSAMTLDFLRSPPGNRLEALSGSRQGQHSIRINKQWRVCFIWQNGSVQNVEIVDYH